eukprot:gb/GECG01006041.1/.p1 GENE.gb/GECG01006041.1/~~gb/GECG01006041.1/.p1  ORF type:complete len:289 (+),score=37.89 gb/GECG01006041.1/:1-867(+)
MAEEFERVTNMIFELHADADTDPNVEGFQFRGAGYGIPMNVFYNIRCNDAKYFTDKLAELIPKLGYDTYQVALFPTSTPQGLAKELEKMQINGKPVFPFCMNVPCLELGAEHYTRLKDGKGLQEAMKSGEITFENASPENIREISFLLYCSAGPYKEEVAKPFEERLPKIDSGIAGQAQPYHINVLMRYKGKPIATGDYFVTEDGIGFLPFFAIHPIELGKGFSKLLLQKLVYDAINIGGAKRILMCNDMMQGEEDGTKTFAAEGFEHVCDATFCICPTPASAWAEGA